MCTKYAYNLIGSDAMELKNPLYNNIGIHVVNVIFTAHQGEIKVLLIKRTNEPYKNYFSLPGGALYNNELILDAAYRELKEKTGLSNVKLRMHKYYDNINRSPLKRMIALSFIGVIDINKALLLKNTNKASIIEFINIKDIPSLAYDYNEILNDAIDELKVLSKETSILKDLLKSEFVLPELLSIYEIIFGKEFDRRNFRKKLISTGLIKDTNKYINYKGNKPAKLYKFND